MALSFLTVSISPLTALENKSDEDLAPMGNPYLHPQEIALKFSLNYRIQADELEGGYILAFDHTGRLKNPEACHLSAVQRGMRYASYEAHLVMGILIEELHKKITYNALFHFLAAASGDDGVNNKGNGGTSPAIAFYNIRRLNKIFSQQEEVRKSIPEKLLKDFYKIYEKCSQSAFREDNLITSFNSIKDAIMTQSRSLKASKSYS